MDNEIEKTEKENAGIFTRAYWRDAASLFGDVRTIAMMAMIIALRVAVKLFNIPLAADLHLSFDCYVNAVGAIVYGPLCALAVGAVSDTLGCIIMPSGAYFFPFIFVEMLSGFIFALFFWRKKFGLLRSVGAKFTVNFVCNIILTSLCMKWQYRVLYGGEKAYNLINAARIVKNLILFPIEAWLITLFVCALLPALKNLKLIPPKYAHVPQFSKVLVIIEVAAALAVSVGLILFYVFFLKDFISAHNVRML